MGETRRRWTGEVEGPEMRLDRPVPERRAGGEERQPGPDDRAGDQPRSLDCPEEENRRAVDARVEMRPERQPARQADADQGVALLARRFGIYRPQREVSGQRAERERLAVG